MNQSQHEMLILLSKRLEEQLSENDNLEDILERRENELEEFTANAEVRARHIKNLRERA